MPRATTGSRAAGARIARVWTRAISAPATSWSAPPTPTRPTRANATGSASATRAHYVVDGDKARIILATLVAPAEVPEDRPALDLFWHARFRWRLWPRQATGDKAYGTLDLIRTLEDQGLRAYIPLPDFESRTKHFGKLRFSYDPTRDVYTCPGGTTLPYVRPNRPLFHHVSAYRSSRARISLAAWVPRMACRNRRLAPLRRRTSVKRWTAPARTP